MGFSLRDEKGQGIVEYILVLVVAVSIILGGVYQLNMAFKGWANNYFGNYLACLLETGDLPSLSGSPGDSGLCNQFFKPFSLADGRPLIGKGQGSGSGGSGGSGSSGGGTRESAGGGAGSSTSHVGTFGSFGSGRNGASLGSGSGGKAGKFDSTYTGDTSVNGYSGGYSPRSSRTSIGLKTRLDDRFAFQNDREAEQARKSASIAAAPSASGQSKKTAIRVRGKDFNKDANEAPDTGFTIAGFLRYFIIAAIIIAMVVFLGGQGLQIGKSMDG